MTIDEMFGQSGVLVLFGMLVVFSFLATLVGVITLSGFIIRKLGLDKEENNSSFAKAATAGAVFDGAITAAITAAVTKYREEK
ncbi:MAG: hypothetical protein Ta2G_05680 [Termitinemataceae bacterium]|nr:MAG: hypothetical protein Ta2G_05680 [Termitinemataceae bacterium]